MREDPAQLRPQLGVTVVPGGGNAAEKQQVQVLVAVIEDEVGGHDGLLLVGLDHPAHELRQGAATARGRHREAEDDVAAHATCRFGVVGTASPRSWYRCSAYPVLQGGFLS